MYVFEGHRIAPFSHKICPFDHIITPFDHLQHLRTPSAPSTLSNPFNTFGKIRSPSATFAPASLNPCTSSAFSGSFSAKHPFDLVDLVGCHALCGDDIYNTCMHACCQIAAHLKMLFCRLHEVWKQQLYVI